MNAWCHIDGGSAGVRVGKNSQLGPGCYMFAFNHGIHPDFDVKDQNVSSERLTIGQDCWVRFQFFGCRMCFAFQPAAGGGRVRDRRRAHRRSCDHWNGRRGQLVRADAAAQMCDSRIVVDVLSPLPL